MGRIIVLATLLGACGGDDGTVGTGATVTMDVGTDGGTVELEGVTLEIPAGALVGTESITVTSTTDVAPNGFSKLSPIYEFEPDGLVFEVPATVTIAFTGSDGDAPSLIWSSSVAGGGFDDLGGTIVGDELTGEVGHFSKGFVGVGGVSTPDAMPDTCGGGLTSCAGQCVDTQSNSAHCGSCDTACSVGEACYNGECVAGA